MSSKARNFRRRADEDDEEAEPPSNITPKPKKSQNQAPKRLSFADDEDVETPLRPSSKHSSRHGKPSSSHRITTLKDRLAHASSSAAPPPPSNVQPQAGTYTKETLRELQKNTRTLASSTRASSDSKSSSSEPIIVLKGLVKPSDPVSEVVKEVEELDSECEQVEKNSSLYHRAKDDAQVKMASMGIANGGMGSSASFPDEETIKAIRAKRERMRQARAVAPDYISLDGGSNHGAAEGLSDEEPEFRGRIAMFGDKMEGTKKGVFEDADERVMNMDSRKDSVDDDDEEEEKIWEEEQVRKGLGKRMDDGSSRPNNSDISAVQQPKFAPPAATAVPSVLVSPSIGGIMGATQGLDVMTISQQAEVAKKAFQENVRRLKESHGRTVSSLHNAEENLSSSLLNITSLENSLEAADEKYKFMQKLCKFVANICDFLQYKAPYIEELEEQMQELHGKRASAIFERRSSDNDDEMMEVEAAVNAALLVFSKKGNSPESIAAAASAARATSAASREQKDLPVKLDEFGRDINLQKRMNIKGRAEARRRRKLRFDANRQSSMEGEGQKMEGESSTDESDSESQAYWSQNDLLIQTADTVFSDAAEEYGELSLVKKRFEEWKRDYPSSYRDAYMSLNLLPIFSPYVRLELLKWDPLHKGSDFHDMKWYKLLFTYGLSEDGGDFASEDDADLELVPNLVEKLALPNLHYEISHCWDMYSKQETENAIAATKLIVKHISHESEALADLLVSIRTRLADAVANITVPTWSTLILSAVPDAARFAAYRFGISIRLLRNICLWKDVFSLSVLEKLALDELLCAKVLPHVKSISENVHDAIARTERIVASIYGVWAGSSVIGDRSRKLQPLVDYVLLLGRILEKRNAHGVTESDTTGLARRLKKILVELNEYDNARNLSRTFHLKEAL